MSDKVRVCGLFYIILKKYTAAISPFSHIANLIRCNLQKRKRIYCFMFFFGTDGIRALANSLLNDRIPFCLGAVLSSRAKKIVVARDVRLSSLAIERQLIEGLTLGDCDILLCGELPTPALSYITDIENADYGVMITASHNPPEYNGLKVFERGGGKLSTDKEAEMDEAVFKRQKTLRLVRGKANGRISVFEGAENFYKRHVVSLFSRLDGLKVALDCARGSMASLAAEAFESAGAIVVNALNNTRDGERVNVKCGATNLDYFLTTVNEDEIGFSFDGDGDRVMGVYKGKILDGDGMLYALATDMQSQDTLKNNAVCGTIMSNGALEKELAFKGITLFRSDVGDKYVMEKMRAVGSVLGGETSGHIITPKAPTGDGLITAFSIAEYLKKYKILPLITPYPSLSFNIPSAAPAQEVKKKEFVALIENAKAFLGENGKLIVRPSGTEPVVRITVECHTGDLEYAKNIKNLFLCKN